MMATSKGWGWLIANSLLLCVGKEIHVTSQYCRGLLECQFAIIEFMDGRS
jgi:hypothetical protein